MDSTTTHCFPHISSTARANINLGPYTTGEVRKCNTPRTKRRRLFHVRLSSHQQSKQILNKFKDSRAHDLLRC